MIFHCQMKICPCSFTFFVELCFIIPRGLLSLFLFTAGSILFCYPCLTLFSLRKPEKCSPGCFWFRFWWRCVCCYWYGSWSNINSKRLLLETWHRLVHAIRYGATCICFRIWRNFMTKCLTLLTKLTPKSCAAGSCLSNQTSQCVTPTQPKWSSKKCRPNPPK